MLDELFGGIDATLSGSSSGNVHEIIADGDHVVVEHTGRNETPDGRHYNNNYCWVFAFRIQDATAAEARARYQAKVIAPRRARLLAILQRAQRLGLIDPEADLEVAITLCTGSWYATALAGLQPPPDWPARTASLVWRAVGCTRAKTGSIGE